MELNSIITLREDRYFIFQLNYDDDTQIVTLSTEPMKGKFNSIICCVPFLNLCARSGGHR
jgi:phospholipid N-methyltransferase